MTSSTGQITSATNYAPYGNVLNSFTTYDTSLGFTGEYSDPTGLLYLRARYYNSSTGTFMSRDPFRGVMQRVASRNGYSWVEGRVVNAVDPSGMVVVDIWAAAFIMPPYIPFVYYGVESSTEGGFPFSSWYPRKTSVDINAHWQGDNRPFFTGGNLKNNRPHSRVWHHVSFDTERPLAIIAQASSPTHVTFVDDLALPLGSGDSGSRGGHVASPPPERVHYQFPTSVSVTIEAHAANPVISISPNIDYRYELYFDLTLVHVGINTP